MDDGSGSGKRYKKKSFDWYKNVIRTNGEEFIKKYDFFVLRGCRVKKTDSPVNFLEYQMLEHKFLQRIFRSSCVKLQAPPFFFYGMADGFNSDSTSCTFGGLENIDFFAVFCHRRCSPHESEADDYGGDKSPH